MCKIWYVYVFYLQLTFAREHHIHTFIYTHHYLIPMSTITIAPRSHPSPSCNEWLCVPCKWCSSMTRGIPHPDGYESIHRMRAAKWRCDSELIWGYQIAICLIISVGHHYKWLVHQGVGGSCNIVSKNVKAYLWHCMPGMSMVASKGGILYATQLKVNLQFWDDHSNSGPKNDVGFLMWSSKTTLQCNPFHNHELMNLLNQVKGGFNSPHREQFRVVNSHSFHSLPWRDGSWWPSWNTTRLERFCGAVCHADPFSPLGE